MKENLFELLNAPTSLKPKDLSTHIKMQASLPEETRNICSSELFKMDIKLINELTTCRFSRKMPKEDDPEYQAFCEAIAVSGVMPIPYKYFSAEYAALKAETTEYKTAVEALTDPWRVQAYAAQYLRMAQNAESGLPTKAYDLWLKAITFYTKFFSTANVEESYTYRFAPDDEARQKCVTEWENFLKNRILELGDRLKEYTDKHDSKAVNACVKILTSATVKKICPEAKEKTIDLFSLYVNSIKSASDLKAAGDMYAGCPQVIKDADEDDKLIMAMMSAIKTELTRRESVKQEAMLVPMWLKKLDTLELYENGSVMVKIEAKSMYEACAAYLRFALNQEDKKIVHVACLMCVVETFPDDVFIANGETDPLYRKDIAPLLLAKYTDILIKATTGTFTESKAVNLARALLPVANTMGRDDTAFSAITCSVNYMTRSKVDAKIIISFLNVFPDDTKLRDDSFKTVEALKMNYMLKDLSNTECTDSNYASLVKQVIDYANKIGKDNVGGETFEAVARKVVLNEFIGAANKYQSASRPELLATIKLMANWLKYTTEVPASGGEKITIGDVIKNLQNHAQTQSDLECLNKLHDAETGSQKELEAVKAAISFADKNKNMEIQGTELVDLVEKMLMQAYIANANAYCNGDGSTTNRVIMHTIAEWMPKYTSLPGTGVTMREFDDQAEPKHKLISIKQRLDRDYFTEEDIDCLGYFIKNWPDFSLGGSMFKAIAKNYLHAMLVRAANGIQRSRYEWEEKFSAALAEAVNCAAISGDEGKVLGNIVDHFNISIGKHRNSYCPDYPPFGDSNDVVHSGTSHKKRGFFAWIKSLFSKK